MLLWNKYKGQEWFESANTYCFHRFNIVESRLLTASRYVEINTDNRATFSYEFASILRDCGSIFASTIDAFVKGTKTTPKPETYFSDYRDFLCEEITNINKISLQIRPCFPSGLIVPFQGLEKPTGTPNWWDAYNHVKHNEHEEFRWGNLENCVIAISALALLGFYTSWFRSDQLFANVGMPYDESMKSSVEKLLFPPL